MKHIRSVLGGAIVGSAAAFSIAACSTVQVAPAAQVTSPAPVVASAPAVHAVVAPTNSAAPSTKVAKHRATTSASKPTTTTTKTPKHSSTSTTNGAGCGQRAVTAGVFNPSCSEYQGYLDPGLSGGRAPSSGDIQNAWADCTATKSVAECRKELN